MSGKKFTLMTRIIVLMNKLVTPISRYDILLGMQKNPNKTSSVSIIAKVGKLSKLPLPLAGNTVRAGFPSPADDYVERTLDLNELCIHNPPATFFVRVDNDGDSMINAGIYPGDLLVIDRSIRPTHGDYVIAQINGEFTLKEMLTRPSLALISHNPNYPDIRPDEGDTFEIIGVVTNVVRQIKRHRL